MAAKNSASHGPHGGMAHGFAKGKGDYGKVGKTDGAVEWTSSHESPKKSMGNKHKKGC